MASASILAFPASASAQSATDTVMVAKVTGATAVTEGDYYTQVQLNIGDLRPPTDDDGQRNFGKALLNVLGLDKKTRAITVTATLSTDGVTMPEVPLITYYFDSGRRLTNYAVTDGYLSPRWNLPPGTPINITLRYRYVENTQYNPNFLTDSIGTLIPSSTVVHTLSGPFIGGISDLASSVFEAAGSREINVAQTQPLYPYATGAAGSRGLNYTIQVPGRGAIGNIEARMLVTPSLRRSPDNIANVTPQTLQHRTSDNPAELSLAIQGQDVNLLDDIVSLPAYTDMKYAITRESVSAFCNQTRSESNAYGLTRMDRNNLILRAMLDADLVPGEFRQDVNDWMSVCFNAPSDQAYLTDFRNVSFALPADPTPPEVDPTFWPLSLKWAMGCHMRLFVGPRCSDEAPEPAAILRENMADRVEVGFVALPTVDQTGFPIDRMVQSEVLIAALAESVDRFACFSDGLILIANDRNYTMRVTYSDGAIRKLDIRQAPDGAENCLG